MNLDLICAQIYASMFVSLGSPWDRKFTYIWGQGRKQNYMTLKMHYV